MLITEFLQYSLPSGCPPTKVGVTRSLRAEKSVISQYFFKNLKRL